MLLSYLQAGKNREVQNKVDTSEEKSHPQNECFNFTEIGVVENGVENYVSHVNAFNARGAEKALTGND